MSFTMGALGVDDTGAKWFDGLWNCTWSIFWFERGALNPCGVCSTGCWFADS